jgi:hypothetical protein
MNNLYRRVKYSKSGGAENDSRICCATKNKAAFTGKYNGKLIRNIKSSYAHKQTTLHEMIGVK